MVMLADHFGAVAIEDDHGRGAAGTARTDGGTCTAGGRRRRSARWARGRLPRTTRGARPGRIAHGRCSEPLAYWCVASNCARPRPASSRAAAPSSASWRLEPTGGPGWRWWTPAAGGGAVSARGLRSRASPIPLRALTVRTRRGTQGQHNSIMRTRGDLGSQRPAESVSPPLDAGTGEAPRRLLLRIPIMWRACCFVRHAHDDIPALRHPSTPWKMTIAHGAASHELFRGGLSCVGVYERTTRCRIPCWSRGPFVVSAVSAESQRCLIPRRHRMNRTERSHLAAMT